MHPYLTTAIAAHCSCYSSHMDMSAATLLTTSKQCMPTSRQCMPAGHGQAVYCNTAVAHSAVVARGHAAAAAAAARHAQDNATHRLSAARGGWTLLAHRSGCLLVTCVPLQTHHQPEGWRGAAGPCHQCGQSCRCLQGSSKNAGSSSHQSNSGAAAALK